MRDLDKNPMRTMQSQGQWREGSTRDERPEETINDAGDGMGSAHVITKVPERPSFHASILSFAQKLRNSVSSPVSVVSEAGF